MTATPDGRLWIGAAPNYGLRGGPLGWYDPKTAARGFHREVLPDTSPNCLLYLPELNQLLIGLGVEPGSGVTAQRPDGAFALWDVATDQLAHAGDLGLPGIADICSLVPVGRDGLVYALSARPRYMIEHYGAEPRPMQIALVDVAHRRVLAAATVPAEAGDLPEFSCDSLRRSEDGAIFFATAHGVHRVDPETCATTAVWLMPEGEIMQVVGPLVGRRLFFATGWRLRAITLEQS